MRRDSPETDRLVSQSLRTGILEEMYWQAPCTSFFPSSVNEIAGSGLSPSFPASVRSTERLFLLHTDFLCGLATLSSRKMLCRLCRMRLK